MVESLVRASGDSSHEHNCFCSGKKYSASCPVPQGFMRFHKAECLRFFEKIKFKAFKFTPLKHCLNLGRNGQTLSST